MYRKRKFLRITIHNKRVYIYIILSVLIILISLVYGYKQYTLSKINTYDGCVKAGFPIQETDPSKCTVNGKTYVEKITKKITTPSVTPTLTPAPTATPFAIGTIVEPISNSLSRITKKPYGIYVTPTDSPIQPEKFFGFHTGSDFETLATEANTAVPISAICDGKIRLVGPVEGYGGAVIQDCNINGQQATVLYGHLDIATSNLKVNSALNKKSLIANLALANSTGSGGERKHLHLGIHFGENIEFRGYVQNESELSDWLNYKRLFK